MHRVRGDEPMAVTHRRQPSEQSVNAGTVITIAGAGRSGSTMLGAMLGRHSNAFYCGEVHAWYWPFRTHNRRIITESGRDVWDVISRFEPEEFHRSSCRYLNVDFIIDSSKSLSWIVCVNEWARQRQMKVVNLLLWKDPADLAYSHWKRNMPPTLWRRVFRRYYGNFFSLSLPFASIHYTRLAHDPVGCLRRIGDLVGLSYEPGMERFWESPASHVFGSLGTREQMRTGEPRVARSRSYDPDFLTKKGEVEKAIGHDAEVSEVLRMLRASDLFLEPTHLERPYVARYPRWYYEERLKRKILEYFPKSSATVQ